MSRKTKQWQKIGRQSGWTSSKVVPRHAVGTCTFRGKELTGEQVERSMGKICTRDPSPDKFARMSKHMGSKPVRKRR